MEKRALNQDQTMGCFLVNQTILSSTVTGLEFSLGELGCLMESLVSPNR